MKPNLWALISLISFSGLIYRAQGLNCLDYNGKEIDWYSLYKLPKIEESSNILVREGSAFFYMDVVNPQWTLSKLPVSAKEQTSVYHTLQQIYEASNKTILHILYNDEKALQDGIYSSGHTKGVVAFDNESGFWLIHSVPKFPPPKNEGFSYPGSGLYYGQSFLCISFPYKELGNIAKLLHYNHPHIYDDNIPPSMYNDFPGLKDIWNKVKSPPWYTSATLVSKAGQDFIGFAKAGQFLKDLYADLIAPTLKTNILVESWLNGEGTTLPSNCSIPYKVYNVNDIALPGGITFKETKDHSKWATTINDAKAHSSIDSQVIHMAQENYWTCIGDINRKSTQKRRGGGSMCINNKQFWKNFRNAVKSYDPCN